MNAKRYSAKSPGVAGCGLSVICNHYAEKKRKHLTEPTQYIAQPRKTITNTGIATL